MKLNTPKLKNLKLAIALLSLTNLNAQDLPAGLVMKPINGGTFIMGGTDIDGLKPDLVADHLEHEVTLSDFSMSEAEITNAQYLEFLNAAMNDGLLKVDEGTTPPTRGKLFIMGTGLTDYEDKILYSLEGTRVMKDHDNADDDGDEFTGVIEPENPLNIAYIGYDSEVGNFYMKDPHNVDDFNWYELCEYQNYGTEARTYTDTIQNDFDDWAGAGSNHSDELEGWTAENPSAATKLPTKEEVLDWPVTFTTWYGARAFAQYYGLSLPTEAQWEYAAKGGADFKYAVHDGLDTDDANWNYTGLGTVAYHHVRSAISGKANPYGLYNLAGNAWEWMADDYEAYSTEAVTDPLIETGSTTKSWRGGSWNYHESTLQTEVRFNDEDQQGNDHFGFRVAGTAESVGIEEQGFNFNLYPNPTNGMFTVESTSNEPQVVNVYNTIGELIYWDITTGTIKIETDEWTPGIYFVEHNGTTQKLIKK